MPKLVVNVSDAANRVLRIRAFKQGVTLQALYSKILEMAARTKKAPVRPSSF